MKFISDEKIIHNMSALNEPIEFVNPGETFVFFYIYRLIVV